MHYIDGWVWPQDRSEHSGEEKSLFPFPAVEHEAMSARIM